MFIAAERISGSTFPPLVGRGGSGGPPPKAACTGSTIHCNTCLLQLNEFQGQLFPRWWAGGLRASVGGRTWVGGGGGQRDRSVQFVRPNSHGPRRRPRRRRSAAADALGFAARPPAATAVARGRWKRRGPKAPCFARFACAGSRRQRLIVAGPREHGAALPVRRVPSPDYWAPLQSPPWGGCRGAIQSS